MGIFTGIEILFFILGAGLILLAQGLIFLKKMYNLDWKGMILGGLGTVLALFTVAWSVSSILEGEPQAASMGLLIFGAPVLVIFGFFKRVFAKSSQIEKGG